MTAKLLLPALILCCINNMTFPNKTHSTNIEFYDLDFHCTSMRITFLGGRSKGVGYHNNAIIVIKNSDEISAHHIGDLQSIKNAFITGCSSFDVIEHGANKRNEALCNDVAILQAYEKFKKDHEQSK